MNAELEQMREDLLRRLDEVRQSRLRVQLTTGMFLHGALLVTAALVFVAAISLADPSPRVRIVSDILFFVWAIGLGVWLVLRPFLQLLGLVQSDSDATVARRVGAFFPTIRDRLLNVLQLTTPGSSDRELYSVELLEESLRSLTAAAAPLDFGVTVDARSVPRAGRWFALSVMVAALALFAFPGSTAGAIYRLVHPSRSFAPAPRYTFDVLPGNRELVKGESAEVRVRVIPSSRVFHEMPRELTLLHRIQGQDGYDETILRTDTGGVFRTVFSGVRNTTVYFARCEAVESERYTLTVQDRPIVRSLRLRIDHPAYTKLPPRVQDEFSGDVTALAGSRITVAGAASKPIRDAALLFSDSGRTTLAPRGDRYGGSFTLLRDGSYTISLTDEDGLHNIDPVRYQLKAIIDEPPTVTILEPGRNLDIAGGESLGLRLRTADDFGFSSMHLAYRLIKSRFEAPAISPTIVPIPLPAEAGVQMEIPFSWKLETLHLVPEDVVEYYVEVADNDAVRGPKHARSAVYQLRLPSLDEVFADARQTQDRSLDDLAKSVEESQKLKQQVDAIDRDLKQNKDPDWQTQKKMEEMAKRYQALQKKVEEVRNRLEQMTQQMQQQNVLSPETLEKYLELQQLFQEINSAELQKILKQLQQAMPNLTKEQLRQAMEKMSFSEEQFRQNIERTMNLLKRIQIEQKMDEVKRRAEELTEAQRQIEERSAATQDSRQQEDLAKRQEDLASNEKAMERESQDLQRRMEEFFTELPADKMQKLNEALQEQHLSEEMNHAAQQMRQGNRSSAQRTQQQAMQRLGEFRQELDAMQQEMMQQLSQNVLNNLRKATYSMLELSKRQEALKLEAQNAPANSPQLRDNAQRQNELSQDLQNVITDLNELSQKSFAVTPAMGRAIGEAMARMKSAQQGLETRNGPYAAQEQGSAMAALNRAAQQIQASLNSMMQGGGSGAGSLLQQLRALAGQQLSVNMQTQQLSGMSPQQAAEAGRLAQQQEAVRKSLDQLNTEAERSGDRDRLLGDLTKIGEEMKEVVRNLQQNNVDPTTIRTQERILSRMLDAATSMHERDFEKRRKAQTGTSVARRSPAELDPSELDHRAGLREDLLKALEQGYAKEYQQLIRKYFEGLEQAERPHP